MACAPSVHHYPTRSLQVLTPITIVVSTFVLLLSPSISLVQASNSEPSQQAGLSFLHEPKEEVMIKQYDDKISKLKSTIKMIWNACQWVKVGVLEEVKKKYPAIDISEFESKYNEVKTKLDIVRGLSETTRGAFIHFCTLMRTNGAPDLQTSKAKLDRSIEETEEKLTPLEPIIKGKDFYYNVVRRLWHAQHDATSRANKGYKPLEPDSVLEQLDGKVVSTIVDAYVKLLSCTSDAEEAMQAAETALQEYKIALGLTSNKSETIMDKCCNSLSCLCMPTIPCVSNPLCQFGLFAGGFLLGKLSSDEFREAFKVRNYINETTTTTSTTTTTGSTLVGSTSIPVGIPSNYSYSSDGNSQLWSILMAIVVVGLLFCMIFALAFYYFYCKQNTSNSTNDLEAKNLKTKCPGSSGPTTSQSQQRTTSATTDKTITGSN